MPPAYSFAIDPARDLVRITIAGFFTAPDIAAFARGLAAAQRELRCAPNQHVTLVDMRAIDIQAQDSVDAFQRVVGDPATASRRLAFVVDLSLARRQIRRAAEIRGAAFFATSGEAETWLLSDAPPPA
jgi:hypothetical protein